MPPVAYIDRTSELLGALLHNDPCHRGASYLSGTLQVCRTVLWRILRHRKSLIHVFLVKIELLKLCFHIGGLEGRLTIDKVIFEWVDLGWWTVTSTPLL